MASTITLDSGQKGRGVAGDRLIRRGSGNLGVYATNGIAVTLGQFEFPTEISDLDLGAGAGIVFEFDKANMKIKAYRNKDPGAAGGADIALPEVGNAVDITTAAFRFRAEGF